MMRSHRLAWRPIGRLMNMKRLIWLVILMLLLAPPALVRFSPRPVVSASAVAPETGAARPAMPDGLSTVYFAAGTTQIQPSDTSILDAHAAWQREETTRVLVIEGHTDGVGDTEFSREIGEQRARAAKAYLVTRGVIADHIRTESRGGARPVCKVKTPACRALNRRVTVSRELRP